MNYDLIVIGGGPGGMLGAAMAAAGGLKVVLLEKNDRLGKKLAITGNGRCNLTFYGGPDDFFKNVVTNREFLYSAFNCFDNNRLIGLVESLGVRTKVEAGKRVFPATDQSRDVTRALETLLRSSGVEIRLNSEVKEMFSEGRKIGGVVLANGTRIPGKKVLLATGGMSYRQTGSTGDGYRLARQLGHSVVEPKPALVPLVTGERWVKDLQGLSLEVDIRATINERTKNERTNLKMPGEMIFTHFGISGPVVLNFSSFLVRQGSLPVELRIDLAPGLAQEQLEADLQRNWNNSKGKHLKNSFPDLLPPKMIPVILHLSGVDGHKPANQVTKKERDGLADTIKNLGLTITGTRPLNEAIITSGGIDVKEISPSTLESKVVKGLYFAGEVIDVDALTGGYNLQAAFSTGYLSGVSAARPS